LKTTSHEEEIEQLLSFWRKKNSFSIAAIRTISRKVLRKKMWGGIIRDFGMSCLSLSHATTYHNVNRPLTIFC